MSPEDNFGELTSLRPKLDSRRELMRSSKNFTVVSKEDIANGEKDEFGVIYSKDGKQLLKCKKY